MQLDTVDRLDETLKDSQVTVKGRGASPRSRCNLRPRGKGQPSLNPRGRPKKDFELAREAEKYAPVALATLVAVMQDAKAPPASRISAASTILDRAFGRAPQSVNLKTELTFSEQFEDFIRQINARSTAPGGPRPLI